jgi:hypothetical protein
MKTLTPLADSDAQSNPHRAVLRQAFTVLVVVGVSFAFRGAVAMSRPAPPVTPALVNESEGEVLTRGPVHEAFAGMVTFNPQAGAVVPKAPPEAIEELPPDERPAGDNVTWIPGYWAWDDERNDFLWISGVWRALPPGRQWVAGYWGNTRQGSQWTSGYWADATVTETTYLPEPPATVEIGPNIAAPSDDYGWTPGCWVWHQSRYAWRPGYWVAGRTDWDWSPSYYVWTPRGYVFVDGYWDYPVQRRGLLFAPVYFTSGVYSRRGYSYSPSIVIDLGVFSEHLFLRPSYHHYYYGDYYAASYASSGFYASFSFQSSRYGYDPIYAHQRWEHRQDRDWERRVQTTYQNRRDHEAARPPRTWAAQQNINVNVNVNVQSPDRSRVVATPLAQVVKRTDSTVRFQPVAQAERQQIVQRDQEVRKSRNERRTLETSVAATPTSQPGRQVEPSTAKLPRSPIVAKPADQLGRDQAPPKPHKVPEPDLKVGPKREVRPETVDRPGRRESPPAVEQPAKREIPELAPPSKREARPEVERPGRRESPPAVEQPAKREIPELAPPSKREARPEVERPGRRETPPVVEQPAKREIPELMPPSKREAKQEVERPGKRDVKPEPDRPTLDRPVLVETNRVEEVREKKGNDKRRND